MNRIRGHVVYPEKPKLVLSELEKMLLSHTPNIQIMERFDWSPSEARKHIEKARKHLIGLKMVKGTGRTGRGPLVPE